MEKPQFNPEHIGLLRGYALATMTNAEFERFEELLKLFRQNRNLTVAQLAAKELTPTIERINAEVQARLQQP